MENLIAMLKGMDWFFYYSDDHRVYQKGQENMREIHVELNRLTKEQVKEALVVGKVPKEIVEIIKNLYV